jgi:spoIIIJ-associated protein
MKVIESAGKTREEAIQNGLKQLGVDMHDIEKIDVIDEGSKGFLGIGSRPVRVRLTADLAEEQPRRGGTKQGENDRRGGNRQERQPRREENRQDRQPKREDNRGERQQQGGRRQGQQKQQGGGGAADGGRQRSEEPTQGDKSEGQLRKKKKKRPGRGGQDNRNENRNAADNRGAGQRQQKQGNVHKASPVVGRKSTSVTDEASEALRRAENFENNIDDVDDTMNNELPSNARQNEEFETITDEQGKEAAAMLSEVLGLMELGGEVAFARASDGSARLAIDSEEDGGILIGKRGVTLHAIQYLVNRMIAQNETGDNTERVIVDVGGYVDRRHDTLADMARSMARRAKDSGRNVRLKPLSPQERRIVHLTLEPDPQVRTYSLGDSLFRSIVINPVGGRGSGQNRRERDPRDRNRDADAATD